MPKDLIGDVYDGAVWREFKDDSGSQFTESPYNLMLFLNVDWFQPFTHLTYSVGALYLTVQNLPRTERFKFENSILVALIPLFWWRS